jgi:23S rRNA (cytidine1920-2'-O)/16S rRNA (cytidine1409-2'-O)-methyltransferase
VHRDVLARVLGAAAQGGWQPTGVMASPLRGPAGNREFLAHLSKGHAAADLDLGAAIERALDEEEGA